MQHHSPGHFISWPWIATWIQAYLLLYLVHPGAGPGLCKGHSRQLCGLSQCPHIRGKQVEALRPELEQVGCRPVLLTNHSAKLCHTMVQGLRPGRFQVQVPSLGIGASPPPPPAGISVIHLGPGLLLSWDPSEAFRECLDWSRWRKLGFSSPLWSPQTHTTQRQHFFPFCPVTSHSSLPVGCTHRIISFLQSPVALQGSEGRGIGPFRPCLSVCQRVHTKKCTRSPGHPHLSQDSIVRFQSVSWALVWYFCTGEIQVQD